MNSNPQQQLQPQIQPQLSQRSRSDSIISQRRPLLQHQQQVFSELENIQNDAQLSQRSQSDSQISRLRRQVSIQEPLLQPPQSSQQRSRPASRLSQSQLSVHQEIVPDPFTEQQFLMQSQSDHTQPNHHLHRQQSVLSTTSNYNAPSMSVGSNCVGTCQPLLPYTNATNVGMVDQGHQPLRRSASQMSNHASIDPDMQLNHQLKQISLSASQLSQQLQLSIQSRLQQPQQLQQQQQQPVVVGNTYQQFTPVQQQQELPRQNLLVQQVRSSPAISFTNQQPPPATTDLISSHQSTSLSQISHQPQQTQTTKNGQLTSTVSDKVSQSQQTSARDKDKSREDDPAFEEDRYLYLRLKNRELLLKKIKQCESLETEIRNGWKEHFPDNELS